MKTYLILIVLFGLSAFNQAKPQKRFHFGGKVQAHDAFFAPMLWRPFWSAYEYKCGGVWIHLRFAITSAYCLKYHEKINYVGYLTGDNRWIVDDNKFDIEKKYFYKNYSYTQDKRYDNDIGLVKIRGYKKYDPLGYFPKFYLDDWSNFDEIRNSPSAIFGFGRTESGNYAEQLKYMNTQLHFADSYVQLYCDIPAVNEMRAMCLNPIDRDAHIDNGDMGSPVYFNEKDPAGLTNKNRIIIGIVSFEYRHQRNIVITNTSHYRDFIENIIRRNS